MSINTGFQIQYAGYITAKSFLKLRSSQKVFEPDHFQRAFWVKPVESVCTVHMKENIS